MTDIVVTWPKSRELQSYLDELAKAHQQGLVINYRVSVLPRAVPERCYMVHDGAVRGWNRVLGMGDRTDVVDPITQSLMEPGVFITRDPVWHPLADPIPMRGFQGWRYFDRSLVER